MMKHRGTPIWKRVVAESTDVGRRSHTVRFYDYDNDGELTGSVGTFIGAGLLQEEGIIVIATPERTETLLTYLRELEIDVDEPVKSGQLRLLNGRETLAQFAENDRLSGARFEAVVGGAVVEMAASFPLIRIYDGMADLLRQDRNIEGALNLEELWSDLADLHAFSLLCAYSRNSSEDIGEKRASKWHVEWFDASSFGSHSSK